MELIHNKPYSFVVVGFLWLYEKSHMEMTSSKKFGGDNRFCDSLLPSAEAFVVVSCASAQLIYHLNVFRKATELRRL